MTPDLTWMDRGPCLTEDPELFFPISTGASCVVQTEKAKAVCAGCPVRESHCLPFALGALEFGIAGGLTEEERKSLKRRTYRQAAAANGAGTVTVIGMSRRLQALGRIGWTGPALAEVARGNLGYHDIPAVTLAKVLCRARAGQVAETRINMARLIAALYNALRGQHGPDSTNQVVTQAERDGWFPPSAWAGLNIDDPTVTPATGPATADEAAA